MLASQVNQASSNQDKKIIPPTMSLQPISNNPFLNPRLASPGLPTPSSPATAPARPISTNPFLAAFEQDLDRKMSPFEDKAEMERPVSKHAPTIGEDAKELFKRLTVTDNVTSSSRPTESSRGPAPNRERGHARPNKSNETPQFKKGPNGLLIPVRSKESARRTSTADSVRRDGRSRRNSDPSSEHRSSLTPEEREARERRRRERASRHGRASSRDSKMTDITIVAHATDGGRKRRNKHVDVVDKLDVTGGLYGVGGMWHHDGPFDACRPQRNRKRDNMAPMGAFPTNSANQTMGGSGPVNKNINLEQFHGRGTEGYNDYAASSYDLPKPANTLQPVVMNATNKVEPLHGEESLGLGTSTFLEGAPASRADMQRTKSDSSGIFDGLTRKKSIAARFRGMSQSKVRPYDAGAPPTPSLPEEAVGYGSPASSPARRKTTRQLSENNPLENQYDDAYEKKGAAIKEAEVTMGAPLSPKREPLSRRSTTDNVASPDAKSPSSGFLGRVKSLKGGSGKARADRNAS